MIQKNNPMKEQIFNSSMGVGAYLITLIAFIIVAYTAYIYLPKMGSLWSIAIFALAAIAFLLVPYILNSRSYRLSDDALLITRPIGHIRIPFDDISGVQSVRDAGFLRVFGVGGLWGWYGKFWNKNFGFVSMYAGNRKNFCLLNTKSRGAIILSPDDSSMVDTIRNRIHI